MKNIMAIVISILVILTINYWGHVNPPLSIFLTPIVIGVLTALILYFTNYHFCIKFCTILCFIILNDVLIKLFAGGTHDWPGLGFLTLFLFIGLFISLIIIFIYGFTEYSSNKPKYFIALIGFGLLFYFYQLSFSTLGMVWIGTPTKNITISQQKELFIREIDGTGNSDVKDSLFIKYGWIEEQKRFDHRSFLKKDEVTDKYYCSLIFEEFDSGDEKILYKRLDVKTSGYRYLDKKITITIDKYCNQFKIGLYDNNKVFIKELEIITATNPAL